MFVRGFILDSNFFGLTIFHDFPWVDEGGYHLWGGGHESRFFFPVFALPFSWNHLDKNPKNLRIFQHTPGTYPRPPTNGLWRNSFHLGVLRYAPRVCWDFLRKKRDQIEAWSPFPFPQDQKVTTRPRERTIISPLKKVRLWDLLIFPTSRKRWDMFFRSLEGNLNVVGQNVWRKSPLRQWRKHRSCGWFARFFILIFGWSQVKQTFTKSSFVPFLNSAPKR